MAAFYLAEIVSAQAADIAHNLDFKSAFEHVVAEGILDGKDEFIFDSIFTSIIKKPIRRWAFLWQVKADQLS